MENKKVLVDIVGLKKYHDNLKTNVLSIMQQSAADDATTKANNAQEAAILAAEQLAAEISDRVADLEAIDHNKLVETAAAAAVAEIVDGASDSFDTLKEVAEWIANNEHADDVAALVTDVANLKAIDHDAYKNADEQVLEAANAYVDGLVKNGDGSVKFDVAGTAAEAAAEAFEAAKADAAGLYQVKGDYLTESDFDFAGDSDINDLFD